MQKILLIGAFVAISCLLMAQGPVKNYQNPVVNYSLPDPSVIKGEDGYYYLYATEDIRNLPIHRSKSGRVPLVKAVPTYSHSTKSFERWIGKFRISIK